MNTIICCCIIALGIFWGLAAVGSGLSEIASAIVDFLEKREDSHE